MAQVFDHIEMGLIERERFDQRGIIGEDCVDLPGHSAIHVQRWWHNTSSAQSHIAVVEGIAERTPNSQAS